MWGRVLDSAWIPAVPRILKFCVCLCFMLMEEDIAISIFHLSPKSKSLISWELWLRDSGGLNPQLEWHLVTSWNCQIQQHSHLAWIANQLQWTQNPCGDGSRFYGFVGKYFLNVHFVFCVHSQIPFSALAVILPQSTYRSSWEYLSSLLVDLPGDSTSI